jgi:photosystem I P700 chlorophyll a apoprotein A2
MGLDVLIWSLNLCYWIHVPYSWRGYWQELIAWAHERTPIADLVRWKDKPVALSIVQARLVGLAHFSAGYILTCRFLNCVYFCKFG